MLPTCCTEAASAQGSFPFVSSLGVSRGGLYFIAAPPAWLEVEEVHMILFFLSLFTAILPALSHLSAPHVISWPDYQATLTGQQPLPSSDGQLFSSPPPPPALTGGFLTRSDFPPSLLSGRNTIYTSHYATLLLHNKLIPVRSTFPEQTIFQHKLTRTEAGLKDKRLLLLLLL